MPAAAFTRTLPAIVDEVLPSYDGALAFAYAQGSLVEGLAEHGDIDVIAVWDGAVPAAPTGADRHERGSWRLDTWWLDGQQVDVTHHSRRSYDALLAELDAGRGWTGWPTPVVMAHGAAGGVALHDPAGEYVALRSRLAVVPDAFVEASGRAASEAVDSTMAELAEAVERDDGLLLHQLLVPVLRVAWVAWYARRGRWFPHEKRLQARVRPVDPALADLELAVWSAPDLRSTVGAARALLDRLSRG